MESPPAQALVPSCVTESHRPQVPWGACVCLHLARPDTGLECWQGSWARELPYLGPMKLDGAHMLKGLFVFWNKVSCSPGWHRTCYVAEDSLGHFLPSAEISGPATTFGFMVLVTGLHSSTLPTEPHPQFPKCPLLLHLPLLWKKNPVDSSRARSSLSNPCDPKCRGKRPIALIHPIHMPKRPEMGGASGLLEMPIK